MRFDKDPRNPSGYSVPLLSMEAGEPSRVRSRGEKMFHVEHFKSLFLWNLQIDEFLRRSGKARFCTF